MEHLQDIWKMILWFNVHIIMAEASETSQKMGAYKSCLSWFLHIPEQKHYTSWPQFFFSNPHLIAKQNKAKDQTARHINCFSQQPVKYNGNENKKGSETNPVSE